MRMMRTFGRAALGFAVATLISVAPVRAADTVTLGTVGSPSANLWPLFIGHRQGLLHRRERQDRSGLYPGERSGHPAALGRLARYDDVNRDRRSDPRHRPGRGARNRALRGAGAALRVAGQAGIKSLKELKGKVISVGGPKDITRIYVERMLAPHGLKRATTTSFMPARPPRAPRRCSAARSMPRSCCRHPIFRFKTRATTISG